MNRITTILAITATVCSIIVNVLIAGLMFALYDIIKDYLYKQECVFVPRQIETENEGYKFDSLSFTEEIENIRHLQNDNISLWYFNGALKDKPLADYRAELGKPAQIFGPDTLIYGYFRSSKLFAIPINRGLRGSQQLYYYLSKRLNRPFLKMYIVKWHSNEGVCEIGYFVEENNDTISVYAERFYY